MSLYLLTSLLGGIGLFLLGMRMMTDGLKLAAGESLQRILRDGTRTRLRGVLSGVAVTALVQSSSAVTVATLGFVNAGLLNLSQAIAVTYGSNVGTTMTGWLVALVGFRIKIEIFALPAIGAGMLLRLFAPGRRTGFAGEAVAGFGLFFVGIATLQTGFADSAATLPLGRLDSGVGALLLFFGSGLLLSVLMQSSSAAIALTISAAMGEAIPLQGAAAMVIGANLGTTSTAALAALGATANARRVALAHVAFNGLTAVLALALLPLLLWALAAGAGRLGGGVGTGTTLALFHTLFNLLGVALMWPLTGRLVRFLAQRFSGTEQDLAQPQHLDRTLVATPALALNAMTLELERSHALLDSAARELLRADTAPPAAALRRAAAAAQLVEAVTAFAGAVQREPLLATTAPTLLTALRAARSIREGAAQAPQLAAAQAQAAGSAPVREWLTQCTRSLAAPPEQADDTDAVLRARRHELRQTLLAEVAAGTQTATSAMRLLDHADAAYHLSRGVLQAARFIAALRAASTVEPPQWGPTGA